MMLENLKLIKRKDLCDVLGFSTSALDELIKRDPTFPRPIKMGESRQAAVMFRLNEVDSWLSEKQKKYDSA